MLNELMPVMAALAAGDKRQARHLLRPLLDRKPSAELWYLAAQASEKPEHELMCLQRALALEPTHPEARRRMRALQTGEVLPPVVVPPPESSPQAHVEIADLPPLKPVRRARKRGWGWLLGCFSLLLLSLTSSYIVLLLLGSGLPGQIRAWLGARQEAVFSDQADAVYDVPPSKRQPVAQDETVSDVLEPGYTHEMLITGLRRGEEVAIALQFFSPNAARVSRNVAIFDPDGYDAGSRCQRTQIIGGDSGVAYICLIDQPGDWSLRVYGREGESTGVYVVTVGKL